jgi:hypothetical protein
MRRALLGFGVGVACGYFLDGAVSVRRKDRAAVHALIPADDRVPALDTAPTPLTLAYTWADSVAELWAGWLR